MGAFKFLYKRPSRGLFVLIALFVACQFRHAPLLADEAKADCSRLVSLAPSITETIYHLGLGQQLVGVTRFCRYPVEATNLPQIGGLLDPNLEAIIGLRPTLVIALKEQVDITARLKHLGLKTISVEHRKIGGIIDSLSELGTACGIENAARDKSEGLRTQIEIIASRVKARSKPRVMVVVGRTGGNDSPDGVFVSGSDGYYNDIVVLAGGENVNRSTTASFPVLSREGIIKVNPEIVIEIIMNPPGSPGISKDAVIKQWDQIPYISAVQKKKIFIFDSDYVSVPGPRFIQLLNDFVQAIHPTNESHDNSA